MRIRCMRRLAFVRVEIQSLDSRRLWAFASSTDNGSEQVGIFVPE